MTDQLAPQTIGQGLQRLDGPAKVCGTAPYAAEHQLDAPTSVALVQSTIPRGRVRDIDIDAALAVPGVLTVLTHRNAPQLASTNDAELSVLQSDRVAFRGQILAAVVAETLEGAREAADRVGVTYEPESHDADLAEDRDDLYAPATVNGGYPNERSEGDVDAAVAAAPATVDQTYRTAWYDNNPIEPHTTIAVWNDPDLVLYDSTQGVHTVRAAMARVLGLEPERIRVISPYVGGGFGSKGNVHVHNVVAALAAWACQGRPVKLALTRHQMFFLAGYRTPTIQHVRLAADPDGRLSAISTEAVGQTSRIKEFAEQTAVPTRNMYAAPNRLSTHRLAPLDVPVPSWMRAPGECPGMFGPEVAMDELAATVGVDPIELRVRNEPEVDPESGKPFSSRNLIACLREGSRRFGWHDRDPRPGGRRDGEWLLGTGVASSTYPVVRLPGSQATIRYLADGRFAVEIGAADIGTGTWTTLTQIAADALGVGTGRIALAIGDTQWPTATVAGGSSGMTCWGSAVVAAAEAFRKQHGNHAEPGASATGSIPDNPYSGRFAMHAFGAQFAEVAVSEVTGEIRVPRLLGVFAAGQIINAATARSQFHGGMIMGLSMALYEDSVFDPRFGHVVNHDFADYHIAAHADVQALEATWVEEHDPYVNPMGSKGIGEIGIVGTAAAIANAAWHATGTRVRDLPLTPDKFLS